MRAVGSVGDKGDTIDRGRQFDPIGLLGDRGDGDLTAHAMTQGPDPPAIRRRFAVQPSSIIAVSAMSFAIVSVPIRRNIHASLSLNPGADVYRHEPHRGPRYRLADRFRIGGIVVVALDESLDGSRRHQLDLMSERVQLTAQ